MTQYEKDRLSVIGMTEAGKNTLAIMGNLLLPSEYDGVLKVKGYYVAHCLSEDGEVEDYDLYDECGNFILSYTSFDELWEVIKFQTSACDVPKRQRSV